MMHDTPYSIFNESNSFSKNSAFEKPGRNQFGSGCETIRNNLTLSLYSGELDIEGISTARPSCKIDEGKSSSSLAKTWFIAMYL